VNASRRIADFLLLRCQMRRLSGTGLQKAVRSFLDEIDLQHLRDTNPAPECRDRFEMYRYLHSTHIHDGAIDFLEFGVFQGDTIREWTKLNTHPGSRFVGFDSFEGLPEHWRTGQSKGHFDVGGRPPVIGDGRVEFRKGWFDATVPKFATECSRTNRKVLHMDADLYGSTLLPLLLLNHVCAAGTLLIFDEFYDRDNEFAAFTHYVRVSRRKYRVLCHAQRYSQLCFELM
jgi:O-methyltransferase